MKVIVNVTMVGDTASQVFKLGSPGEALGMLYRLLVDEFDEMADMTESGARELLDADLWRAYASMYAGMAAAVNGGFFSFVAFGDVYSVYVGEAA